MAQENLDDGHRSGRSGRKGGLGRGLGALIPSGQSEEGVVRERPLDVLFPDLRGSQGGERPARGGSARDLLSPRPREQRPSVSRETIAPSGEDLVEVPGTTFGTLALETIIPNMKQPRHVFEQSELEELAASLKEVGLLQPIVVRPIIVGSNPSSALVEALERNPVAQYELIMGERRFRAAGLAGLTKIPALIRVTEDENLLRDALLENLHRAQLNPLEEAAAYAQLMEDFECTQEVLSKRIARSRSQIANTLRLLRLPPVVQRRLAAGVLSAGHARALLALSTPEQMESLGERIVTEGISVRVTEEMVRLMKDGTPKASVKRPARPQVSPLALQVIDRVSDLLDTEVTITEGKTRGKLVISFADDEDLQRIAGLLQR